MKPVCVRAVTLATAAVVIGAQRNVEQPAAGSGASPLGEPMQSYRIQRTLKAKLTSPNRLSMLLKQRGMPQ